MMPSVMSDRMGPKACTVALCLFAALSAACTAGDDELQTWMDESRRNMPVSITKIAEPKVFSPFRYPATSEVDPFNAAKLRVGIESPTRSGARGPDMGRLREPLESYSLEAFKMVGNLKQGAMVVGLLKSDSAVHQVRVGNYIGQNFGRIVAISETEVAIRESVQDAAGDWVERDTALRLQESGK
jgi:type IV pilus assembly protein PilP